MHCLKTNKHPSAGSERIFWDGMADNASISRCRSVIESHDILVCHFLLIETNAGRFPTLSRKCAGGRVLEASYVGGHCSTAPWQA